MEKLLMQQRSDALTSWVRQFDFPALRNEDDVETKFAIELFRLLGYPEDCRRGKYPIRKHLSGKQKGRKPEPDQTYFICGDRRRHVEGAALLIVEAKKPTDANLDAAVGQALFYASSLKPLIIAVTNGVRLYVVRLRVAQSDEVIFDQAADRLIDPTVAHELLRLLSFEVVKQAHESSVDRLRYEQQVLLADTLRQYPEIQAKLDEGDFNPGEMRWGRTIHTIKPKVTVACELPLAFGRGSCHFEFSNLLRSGLEIHLTHDDVVRDLLVGLHTRPELGTRPYLRPVGGGYHATLGQITTNLSPNEAKDMCAAIDATCGEYKRAMTSTEDAIMTWRYDYVETNGIRGFRILSVAKWLWRMMKRFAVEFDKAGLPAREANACKKFLRRIAGRGDGKIEDEWRIFEWSSAAIRVFRGQHDNVNLWPLTDRDDWALADSGYVDVVYKVPDWVVNSVEGDSKFSGGPDAVKNSGVTPVWIQNVGPEGIWTAEYTREWLINKFVPKVTSHYEREARQFMNKGVPGFAEHQSHGRTPLGHISKPSELYGYIHDVQVWLSTYPCNITATLILPYYEALTELARGSVPKANSIDYLKGKLRGLDEGAGTDGGSDDGFADIISTLGVQMARVRQEGFENAQTASLISATFMEIVKNNEFPGGQRKLNQAAAALRPLWQEQRFERRYVTPLRWR